MDLSSYRFLLGLVLLVLSPAPTLHAQPTNSNNRVLHFEGTKSYLELPPNIFDSLTQATVEGWIRWDNLRSYSRFFDFGDRNREMYVRNQDSQALVFLVTGPDGTRHRTQVAGILRDSEWCHIAALSGPGGGKLYCNGVLVGSNAFTGSFSGLVGRRNFLGKENTLEDAATLQGAIDEARVWDHARTAEQIREGMFKTLTGKEPGLVGYWNCDEDDAGDATSNALEGELRDGATTVIATVPSSLAEIGQLTVLSGTVTDEAGKPLNQAFVEIKQGSQLIRTGYSDIEGRYRFAIHASDQPVALRVVTDTLGAWRTDLLHASGETNLDLVLRDATSLSGKVVALDDSPLPNVVVQAVGIPDYECVLPGGLAGEYYQMDQSFTGTSFPVLPPDRAPTLKRTDPEINFRRRPESEPIDGTTLSNYFCVRWTGAFQLSKSGTFTFEVEADNGARLFIDDKDVVDHSGSHGMSSKTGVVDLAGGAGSGGRHDVVRDRERRVTLGRDRVQELHHRPRPSQQ